MGGVAGIHDARKALVSKAVIMAYDNRMRMISTAVLPLHMHDTFNNEHSEHTVIYLCSRERPSHPRTVELWTSWALLEERCGDFRSAREYLRAALKAERFSVYARATWAALEARQVNLDSGIQ